MQVSMMENEPKRMEAKLKAYKEEFIKVKQMCKKQEKMLLKYE